jgi:CubicO group peptidase (beta-lactamase class C family)
MKTDVRPCWIANCLVGLVLLALGACQPPDRGSTDQRMARVLAGLRPEGETWGEARVRWTLRERMSHYKTPGVSIAVVDGGRIAWARGFGVKEAGGSDPVTPTTLFQAASISKTVAALSTMRLVQEGKLSLDADVNSYLKSWKLPENELSQTEKVTLRRILSHTAGLNVDGFAGFAFDEPMPTLIQVLDGVAPAKNEPVGVVAVPGTRSEYSGGGTVVMQVLVEDVTGVPYPELLKKMVLDPIGMKHSTFEQPLPVSLAPQAAAAHDEDGNVFPGKWRSYPMTAAAGLWTTPSDLARLIIDVQQTYAGHSSRVIDQRSIREMLTVVHPPFGLGFMVEGRGKSLRFSHNGINNGFRAALIGYARCGQGAVVMVNSRGTELPFEILRSIAAEYDWPDC